MVFVKSWEDFEIAAENMYMANPMACRYTMKYVHTKGHILMKMTDNIKVSCYRCCLCLFQEELLKFFTIFIIYSAYNTKLKICPT